ncbi:hypothetical protein JOC77_004360 [Peribacillus deserti]|uniref:Uncharacterized protein n=1 Tax=Peribacillus deserti TaxID=673318 RepID=A0ABS2QNY0_9BACI|nr:hypothetical protein [Peribacillus deserti]MBM7694881.1 hypothetical protein [Peribacillus deserti]
MSHRGIDIDGDGEGDLTKSGLKLIIYIVYNLITKPTRVAAQAVILIQMILSFLFLLFIDTGWAIAFPFTVAAFFIPVYYIIEVGKAFYGFRFFVNKSFKYLIITVLTKLIFKK